MADPHNQDLNAAEIEDLRQQVPFLAKHLDFAKRKLQRQVQLTTDIYGSNRSRWMASVDHGVRQDEQKVTELTNSVLASWEVLRELDPTVAAVVVPSFIGLFPHNETLKALVTNKTQAQQALETTIERATAFDEQARHDNPPQRRGSRVTTEAPSAAERRAIALTLEELSSDRITPAEAVDQLWNPVVSHERTFAPATRSATTRSAKRTAISDEQFLGGTLF